MPPIPTPVSPFGELALLLAITVAAGAVAVRLRQPVLVAYILVGVGVGPAGLGLVRAHEQIDLLAQMGVAVLLFVVGLKLDLAHVRTIGRVALATGIGQLAFTIILGFGLLLLLGRPRAEAVYVAVALTFSSTIIIVKLLSDKRELDSLHGRIAIGFLIVQDIAVVMAMMAMSALRTGDGLPVTAVATSLALRVAGAALVLYLLMARVLPPVVRAMARSQELLLLFAIAWGTGLAALGAWAGFSKEAGAFLAGFSLASTTYREAMSARLTGIRDFLLLFFFLDLGARLDFSTLGGSLWPAAVLSAFVLVGNPLIVMAIMGAMGYRRRTSFLAGLTVAQISEFSIVFVAMGITLGHVGLEALGLTTLVGLVTITASTYMILHAQRLYERLAPWLGVFERRVPVREMLIERGPDDAHPDVLVVGLGRYGDRLARALQAHGLRVLGVDFDPEVVRDERAARLPVRFGDAEDPDFVATLPLAATRWVVCALPDAAAARGLLRGLSACHYAGQVAVVARDDVDATHLDLNPAVLVLHLWRDAVDHVGEQLRRAIRPPEVPA